MPPTLTAFHIGSLIHLLDFDDIHDEARVHPTAVTLAAALAVSRLRNPGERHSCTEAVVAGNELICRLGMAFRPVGTGPGSDWFLTQVFGYFAAALTAGIALELSEDEIVAAMGLAYMQAAGGKEAGFGTGSTARAIYPGFAAMGGVHAALLARAGIVGPETALDGPANFFNLYLNGRPTHQQLEGLLKADGWEWLGTSLKPYPCCRLSHPYVEASLVLARKVCASDVRKIVVSVNPSASKLCHPADGRRKPSTLQDAKYSIPFMIAFSLVHGRVDLANLCEDSIRDAEVLRIAELIDIIEDFPDRPGLPRADIKVETRTEEIHICNEPNLSVDEGLAMKKFLVCCEVAEIKDGKRIWNDLNSSDAYQSTITGLIKMV